MQPYECPDIVKAVRRMEMDNPREQRVLHNMGGPLSLLTSEPRTPERQLIRNRMSIRGCAGWSGRTLEQLDSGSGHCTTETSIQGFLKDLLRHRDQSPSVDTDLSTGNRYIWCVSVTTPILGSQRATVNPVRA